jgi:ribosomal protein L29
MKKIVADLRKKTGKELEKEIQTIKEEIAKLQLEMKVNPVKDTNLLTKKKKKLAILLTVFTEKNNQ